MKACIHTIKTIGLLYHLKSNRSICNSGKQKRDERFYSARTHAHTHTHMQD